MSEDIQNSEAAPVEESGAASVPALLSGSLDEGNGTAAPAVEQIEAAQAYGKIAPRLRVLGYPKPIPIAPGTKKPPEGFYAWTQPATDENIAIWANQFPKAGTGLVCGDLIAIDIDILRDGVAADLEQRTRERLGDTPLLRIGRAPKRLLVYRTETPFAGFKHHPIEVLAQGNQFVAFAIHPDTGKPYRWMGKSPLEVPFADLPVVTEDLVRDLVVELWDMIPPDLLPPPKPRPGVSEEKTVKLPRSLRDLCSAAIADYLAWVPELFPRVRKVGGSLRVRPEWGGCDGNGNGLEEMVGFHAKGIHDFGNERPMTALEVVEKARDCSQAEAAIWLAERLGVEYTPPPTFDEVMVVAKALTRDSLPPDIRHAVALAARLEDDLERSRAESAIKTNSKSKVGDIRRLMAEFRAQEIAPDAEGQPEDEGLRTAHETLFRHYAGGKHLIRAMDRNFWAYTSTHWVRRNDEQVKHHVLKVATDLYDDNVAGIVEEATKVLTYDRAAPDDVLRLTSEPHPVINCKNGELWIGDDGTVEFRPHRAESYLTYTLGCDYDPDAQCPEFDKALLGIFGKSSDPKGMVRHMMEVIGFLIQPKRPFPAWFLLHGNGRNGKSAIMETVQKLVSTDAIHSGRIGEMETNRFAIGELAGKLILLDDDVNTDTKLPAGFIKKISERKPLTGELKFKPCFTFVANCVPVLLSNDFPRTADISGGMRRRVFVIPFDQRFGTVEAAIAGHEIPSSEPVVAEDQNLFRRIHARELSGVLNRAIEGLRRLVQRGRFDEPADCVMARQRWLNEANSLVAFIAERLEPLHRTSDGVVSTDSAALLLADAERPRAGVLLKDVFDDYKDWCVTNNYKATVPRNGLKRALESLDYVVSRNNDAGEHMLMGFRLSPTPF